MFINVNDYKNLSCDSDMINAAIIDGAKSGKMVVIPRINERTGKDIWDITKTIRLQDDTTLILNNCHLRMNDHAVCKLMVNENYELPWTEENKNRNITVKGIGNAMFDGGVHSGIYEKNGIARKVPQKTAYAPVENCTLFFRNVENMVVEGIHIKNHRYWGLLFFKASFCRVSNIRFSSDGNVPNQDGLDLVRGCHDMIVENITGCTGDNLVALCAMGKYGNGIEKPEDGDIYNITIRNVMGYCINGCSLVRLLNHDGFKIYNIRIDNVIETSPWSDQDAGVAPNPDLLIKTDENGEIIPWKKLIPGEQGYRLEAAIIIGESYWYAEKMAEHGDTYGVSISNVMTHARFGIWVNNTLMDSTFDNIRMFGNGHIGVYFGKGEVENLRFSNINYDTNCKPLSCDEHIYIDWNDTTAEGYSTIYFNGTKVKDVTFENVNCGKYIDAFAKGFGEGEITLKGIKNDKPLSDLEGITLV